MKHEMNSWSPAIFKSRFRTFASRGRVLGMKLAYTLKLAEVLHEPPSAKWIISTECAAIGDPISEGQEESVRLLLGRGIDCEVADSRHHQTPLWTAAHYNQEAIIHLLLDYGADINSTNSMFGQTALHAAIRTSSHNDNISLVKLLIRKGADVNIKFSSDSSEKHTALIYEASRGRCETIKLLIESGARINDETSFGDSALIKSSEKRHYSAVKLLLSKGADADHQNLAGHGPIYASIACSEVGSSSDLLSTITAFADHGVDINASKPSALCAAVMKSSTCLVQFLLESVRVDALVRNNHDQTPLIVACDGCLFEERVDIIKLLLEHGADTEGITRRWGDTILAMLCKGQCNSMEVTVELIYQLVTHGANVNFQNRDTMTPLALVCQATGFDGDVRPRIVSLLVERNANVNSFNESGQTPLSIICDNQEAFKDARDGLESMRLMLKNGADIRGVKIIKRSNNFPEQARSLLLEYGASINALG